MQATSVRLGLTLALAAYIWWGLAPIYFKLMNQVSPLEILAHRVVWSCGLLAVLITALGYWPKFLVLAQNKKALLVLFASSLLIGANWLVFIWAINNNQMVEASLGYFINPLISMLLARIFLQERLRPLQLVAVGLAITSLVVQLIIFASFSWVTLVLANTFAFYGLLRKQLAVDAFNGLLFETLILLLPAVIFLFASSSPTSNLFNNSWLLNLALMAAGIITTVPLLLFAAAVKYLSLTSIGFIQYLAPSLMLVIGVLVYDEVFSLDKALVFICIWLALALYTFDSLRSYRNLSLASENLDKKKP